MGQRTAVIFGVNGQDGSYLSEFLLEKDYKVIGVRRRSSGGSLWRLENPLYNENFNLIEGDITDYPSILNILSYNKPDEIYNLAAQSNVGTSFNQPINTWRICAEGTLNILESIKFLRLHTRLYQASSSEMFGNSKNYMPAESLYLMNPKPSYYYQNENTPFSPQSPYAIAKLAAHNSIKLYREAYEIFAVGGILFNHESPRRGVNFVTRKITSWFNKFLNEGTTYNRLQLGNIESYRDWGYAKEYVEAMWKMLQTDNPKDYVIGTGETHSIKEFLEEVIEYHKSHNYLYGRYNIERLVEINAENMRPAEVPYLRANAELAWQELSWKPNTKFKKLVEIMCEEENGQL